MNYPQQIYNAILDTIFPITCIGCGSFSPKNRRVYLCKKCLSDIPVKKDFECIGCKIRSPLGRTCIECRDQWSLDNLFIVSDYNNKLLEKTIKTLKYRFIRDTAQNFFPLLKKYIYQLAQKEMNLVSMDPLILPIPLHPIRLNWRGFNQAELIAEIIAEITNLKINNKLLIKKSISKPQAEIENKQERISNLRDKFKISSIREIENRTVILVDDICTTGATLNEVAKILKENGAKNVLGFVIARG